MLGKKTIRKGCIKIAEANHCMTRVNLKCFHPICSLNPIRTICGAGGGEYCCWPVCQSVNLLVLFFSFFNLYFILAVSATSLKPLHRSSKNFVDIIRTQCKDVHITRKFRFLNFLGILTLLILECWPFIHCNTAQFVSTSPHINRCTECHETKFLMCIEVWPY